MQRQAETVRCSLEDLFDDFGSHRVDKAGRRPVQDDGVDRAQRFKEEGLLQVWAVPVLQPAVLLLLLHVVLGQDFMGDSLLLVLGPSKEKDSLQ